MKVTNFPHFSPFNGMLLISSSLRCQFDILFERKCHSHRVSLYYGLNRN